MQFEATAEGTSGGDRQLFMQFSSLLKEAFCSSQMGEFILPYEAVRQADEPDALLLTFLQSTYDAAADLGNWDRAALER